MHARWLEAVRPVVDGARALEAVQVIATHHRIQSTPGYEDAAAWLTQRLAEAGLAIKNECVPGDGRTRLLGCPMPEGWSCERATADLVEGGQRERIADFEAHPLSLIQRSAPAHGRYRIVAPPCGGLLDDDEDLRGAIVLTDRPVARVHARAVLERGAVGIVFDGRRLLPPVRTETHDRDSLAYTSFWWEGDEPRGWGFVVSPARGAAMREALAHGRRLELDVAIDTRRFEQPITLVTATLPGTCPGEVLLTSHLCHPRPGANDNASGVAALLEAARTLAALDRAGALPRERRTIRVLAMPEFTGTYAWLAADPARARRTIAALNLDMVGADQAAVGSTQCLECAPHFMASFAEDLLETIRHEALDARIAPRRIDRVRYSGGSDHALWIDPAMGVPCPMLIEWPDRWYHSDLDTPDRCDPESLAHAARTAATYALTLATAGAEDVHALARLVTQAARRRLRLAIEGTSPRLRARAEHVRGQSALASLQRLAHGLRADDPIVEAIARALPDAIDTLEDHVESETQPALRACDPIVTPEGGARRPRRLQHALLQPMRHWQEGWRGLEASERAAFLALEDRLPVSFTVIDLAWFAADGQRTLADIALVLEAEGWSVPVADLEALFEHTARLGASTWVGEVGLPEPGRDRV